MSESLSENECPRRGRHLTPMHRYACPYCNPHPTIEVAHGKLEASGTNFRVLVSSPATNQDLRSIAALLVEAADRLANDPSAVDTRIEV